MGTTAVKESQHLVFYKPKEDKKMLKNLAKYKIHFSVLALLVSGGVYATVRKKQANNAANGNDPPPIAPITTAGGEEIAHIAEAIHNITMSTIACTAFGQPADYWLGIIASMNAPELYALKTEWKYKWQDKNIGTYAGWANYFLPVGGTGRSMYEAIYQLACSLPNSIDCTTCSIQNAALIKLK